MSAVNFLLRCALSHCAGDGQARTNSSAAAGEFHTFADFIHGINSACHLPAADFVPCGQKGPLQIEADILHYVARHPEAKDTVEGVAEWWLEPPSRASVAEVKAALEQLVAQGRMAADQKADGRIYYRRARTGKRGKKII